MMKLFAGTQDLSCGPKMVCEPIHLIMFTLFFIHVWFKVKVNPFSVCIPLPFLWNHRASKNRGSVVELPTIQPVPMHPILDFCSHEVFFASYHII